MGFSIIGVGSALPEKTVTNTDLTEILDTSDEWMRTRTGIEERRITTKESLIGLGTAAAGKALAAAGTRAEEIDLLIASTLQGDYVVPSLSCCIAGEIGARSDCITFDVNMGCCGFIHLLSVADAYLRAGSVKKVLLVSAEAVSRFADWKDRSTAVLFGDAAGAAVLVPDAREVFFDFQIKPEAEFLRIDRAADNCPYREPHAAKNTLKMNGQEVYRFASGAIHDRVVAVMKKAGITAGEIDRLVLHQANLRIIQSALYKLQIAEEKVPHNIERYGNTSSASIPVLLAEMQEAGMLVRGERLVLCAFGVGLASAACTFVY